MNVTKTNKYNKRTGQHFYNEDKNKQLHSQIKIHNEHLKNITNIGNYKKLNYKVSKNNIQPMKTKTIKYTRRLRYITSTWRTLIKLKNTENWTWPNTKQKWTLLKLRNTKNLNMTEHKTDINITKNEKTERHFYDGTQN